MSPDKETRAVAREAFEQGYELGYGVEELQPIHHRLIEQRFNRWWGRNYD